MVSSQIINACLVSGFKIMILFAVLAGISVALYLLLPETKGKRPPDVVEELAGTMRGVVSEGKDSLLTKGEN